MRYSLAEVAGADLLSYSTAVSARTSQGPLCVSTTAFHMTNIDQHDLDICTVQKSEEWEVLSVRSRPHLSHSGKCDSNPVVYLP